MSDNTPAPAARASGAPDSARYEYISMQPQVRRDPLSDFLDACAPVAKAFGWQYGDYATCGPRINGDMELVYVLSGESIITVNGEQSHGFAGDMFVIPKYSYSEINTNPADPHENYWLHLDIGDMLCAERLRVLLGGPLLHLGLDSWLLNLYRWLDAEYELQGDGCRASIDALVRLIFLRVIRLADRDISAIDACPGPDNRGSRAEKLLSDCVREITAHRGAISAGELCHSMYVSPAYLRRLFDNMLGMPPSAFIRSVRMREAEIMLLTTTAPISEIASALGFSSPYHFSGEFRRFHSISPTGYRAVARGGQA